MIEKLLDPSSEDDSRLIWDAYGEFRSGFPIENLKPLLTSPLDVVVSRGVFLANELGWRVSKLAPELAQLLDHSSSGIRFDAIGALTDRTTPRQGEILGRLFQHLEDLDRGVRWRMIQFIRLSSGSLVRAAIRHAALQRPQTIYSEIDNEFSYSFVVAEEHVRKMIGHPHESVRLFAAGIALRPRGIVDKKFAEIVFAKGDVELSDFASRALRKHAIPTDCALGRVEDVSMAWQE